MAFKHSKKILFFLSFILFLFDRWLKEISLRKFSAGGEFSLFGDWLKWQLTYNVGVAFGWLINYWLIISLYLVFGGIIVYLLIKEKNNYQFFALSLILFGAASNFWDRIVLGKVIDYLAVKYFTVFNLADVMIMAGVAIVLYLELLKKDKTLYLDN